MKRERKLASIWDTRDRETFFRGAVLSCWLTRSCKSVDFPRWMLNGLGGGVHGRESWFLSILRCSFQFFSLPSGNIEKRKVNQDVEKEVSSKKILQQQENKKGRNSLNSFLPVCLCIPSTHRKRRKEENIKKDDQLYIERRPEHVSFLFSLLNQLFLYIYLYTFILIFWMRIYIKSTERERAIHLLFVIIYI